MPIDQSSTQPPHRPQPQEAKRSLAQALWNGMRLRCPACGQGPLFRSYLKVASHCSACGEELQHQQADDAPPYIVIILLGHILIPVITTVEILYRPPVWIYACLAVPATVLLALWALPRAKGLVVGIQWANRMHGFGADPTPS